MNAPVALFAYNRPAHTRMCVESLLANPQAAGTRLHVFCDGWKSEADRPHVEELRRYVGGIKGFKEVEVSLSETNRGLAESVIAGVTAMTSRFGRVICVEDDLTFSPFFLEYMNRALDTFADDERVGNVHAHLFRMGKLPDTFLIRHADSWGWATWKRAWDKFEPDGAALLEKLKAAGLTHDFDFGGAYPFTRMLERQVAGLNSSWAIRWKASLLVNGMLSVNAGKSLVANNGFDESGTNCGGGELFPTDLHTGRVECFRPEKTEECGAARREFEKMYRHYNSKPRKALAIAKFHIRKALSKLFRK